MKPFFSSHGFGLGRRIDWRAEDRTFFLHSLATVHFGCFPVSFIRTGTRTVARPIVWRVVSNSSKSWQIRVVPLTQLRFHLISPGRASTTHTRGADVSTSPV